MEWIIGGIGGFSTGYVYSTPDPRIAILFKIAEHFLCFAICIYCVVLGIMFAIK